MVNVMEIFAAEIVSSSFLHQKEKKKPLLAMNTQSFQSYSYFVAYKRSLPLRKCKEMCSESDLREVVTANQKS